MKTFGGTALFLERSDINTDEIIPAKYLTEISKTALKPHLLEDLLVDGKPLPGLGEKLDQVQAVVTRDNFGCGSSREHAVWAFEVNGINLIVASSFARIFRQNMFNCGILAIELAPEQLNQLFVMTGEISLQVDLVQELLVARSSDASQQPVSCRFALNPFDKQLVAAGGWLAYADQKY